MSADFDRDGDTDAVLLLKNEGKVVLFENNGTGGFDSDELYVTSGSDQVMEWLAILMKMVTRTCSGHRRLRQGYHFPK